MAISASTYRKGLQRADNFRAMPGLNLCPVRFPAGRLNFAAEAPSGSTSIKPKSACSQTCFRLQYRGPVAGVHITYAYQVGRPQESKKFFPQACVLLYFNGGMDFSERNGWFFYSHFLITKRFFAMSLLMCVEIFIAAMKFMERS
jgi:hypothetical protein